MRLVLDTNVLIAAFITHGVCNELLEHCAVNHEVVLSTFILVEVEEKLAGKFGYSTREAKDVVRLLKSRFSVVIPEILERPVCRDADDDHILATAITGQCSCLITGDKDLLALKEVDGVKIVTPSDFWSMEK